MTQCVSVGLFTLLCFIQMTVWAKDKHGTYIREFKDYPSFRMSIIPFLL
ncbi:TECR: Trans-2-3-enoyl-CoA reductase [Crotalus adamanteus]|uniref:TECR: Trans-2-3-enoyl-CoA reductase n=2 Tax=Crotalus TaxID=8728 RepID=A0AAW1BP12_CROAD